MAASWYAHADSGTGREGGTWRRWRKSAAERRRQAKRSETGVLSRLLSGLQSVKHHRGSQLSRVGLVLYHGLEAQRDYQRSAGAAEVPKARSGDWQQQRWDHRWSQDEWNEWNSWTQDEWNERNERMSGTAESDSSSQAPPPPQHPASPRLGSALARPRSPGGQWTTLAEPKAQVVAETTAAIPHPPKHPPPPRNPLQAGGVADIIAMLDSRAERAGAGDPPRAPVATAAPPPPRHPRPPSHPPR